jgi:hypothetical protein
MTGSPAKAPPRRVTGAALRYPASCVPSGQTAHPPLVDSRLDTSRKKGCPPGRRIWKRRRNWRIRLPTVARAAGMSNIGGRCGTKTPAMPGSGCSAGKPAGATSPPAAHLPARRRVVRPVAVPAMVQAGASLAWASTSRPWKALRVHPAISSGWAKG